jgi:hypothetical protein
MKLRFDPYQIFRCSKTPAGLYARQKWLGEADSPEWQADFQNRVKKLSADQLPNGSWRQSYVITIVNLFGLHLTLRATNNRIDDALGWLLDNIRLNPTGVGILSDMEIQQPDLTGLPFVSSRSEMFLTAATLFLSTIFNRSIDPKVLTIYKWLCKQGLTKEGLGSDLTALHNVFRAMVVHPKFAKEDLSVKTVEIYAELQTKNGDWGHSLPFYQTLNAVAHLNSPQADILLEPAFARLIKTQNSDGTWGQREPEWNTFLAIHALKNKNLL